MLGKTSIESIGAWAVITPKSPLSVRKMFTISTDKGELRLYEDMGNGKYCIPRGLFSIVPERRPEWDTTIEFNGSLKPEQQGALNKMLGHLENHNGVILKAPTGTGKTVIACALMNKLSLKTLIVVHTDYLFNQWIDRVKSFSQVKDIGVIRGSTTNIRPVTVGMIHSIVRHKDRLAKFRDSFGLVIFDETHILGATTFSQAVPIFSPMYRVGLSATPRRKDGADNVFLWHIGDVCEANLDTPPLTVIPVFYDDFRTHHQGCVWGGTLILGRYLNKIACVDARNCLITDIICQALDKEKQVLVLSDRLSQIEAIHNKLKGNGIESGIFTGNQKTALSNNVILATYGSAGTGADIPRLDTLILATPRVDIEQAVGRIMRNLRGKNPVVVDIVDYRSVIMQKWYSARKKYYSRFSAVYQEPKIRRVS